MHHLLLGAAHRGCGVGHALIDASVSLSKRLNCKYLTVGTHPENIAAAQVYLATAFDLLPDSGTVSVAIVRDRLGVKPPSLLTLDQGTVDGGL